MASKHHVSRGKVLIRHRRLAIDPRPDVQVSSVREGHGTVQGWLGGRVLPSSSGVRSQRLTVAQGALILMKLVQGIN